MVIINKTDDVMAMAEINRLAKLYYDGHFSLMRFTTNWRCCFGTVNSREDIEQMAEGDTMAEAIWKCIDNRKNSYTFN